MLTMLIIVWLSLGLHPHTIPPIYDWDFRNASASATITDSVSQLDATHTGGLPEDRTPTGIILENPSYIDLGSPVLGSAAPVGFPGGPMTFEMVVTWLGTGFVTNMPLFDCARADISPGDQILVDNGGGLGHHLRWSVYQGLTNNNQLSSGEHVINLDVRYHIVTTVKGNATAGNAVAAIYVDGVQTKLSGPNFYAPRGVGRGACYVGKCNGALGVPCNALHATVSSLKLYDYPMTEAEVKVAYDEDCVVNPECAAPTAPPTPATSSGGGSSSSGGYVVYIMGGLLVVVIASVVMSARPTVTIDTRRVRRIHYSEVSGVF
jgi:hypothetical protein